MWFHHFSLPLPPSQPSIYYSLLSLKPMASFVISCSYMHMFLHVYICVCTYNLKHSLLGLYSVTCVHVSRANHFVLDNQLLCSSLRRLFLLLFYSFDACSSLCSVDVSWASAYSLFHLHVCCLRWITDTGKWGWGCARKDRKEVAEGSLWHDEDPMQIIRSFFFKHKRVKIEGKILGFSVSRNQHCFLMNRVNEK